MDRETSPISLHSDRITARFLLPDGSETTKSLEIRLDPLLGTSSRIAEGVILPKADAPALAPLQLQTQAARSAPIESAVSLPR